MDTDIETMIAVFDEALTSDDQRVKHALNSLVMMVSLTRDMDSDNQPGPLARVWDAIDYEHNVINELQREVKMLHRNLETLANGRSGIRGNRVDQIWVDELSQLPSTAWHEYLKKDTKA